MSLQGAQERITKTVTSWDVVTVQSHRLGGVEYIIGKPEIGHIHGDHMVDIPFPKKMRDKIVAAGRAQPYHILPETGGSVFRLIGNLRGSPQIWGCKMVANRRV